MRKASVRKPITKGKLIAYVRATRGLPTVRTQRRHLLKFPIWNVYVEKDDDEEFPQFNLAKMDLRPGDTLIVYKWAVIPSVLAFRELMKFLHANSMSFMSIQEGTDFSDEQRMGLFVAILEKDRAIKGEHIKLGQIHGYEERGTWPGRPKTLTGDVVKQAEALIASGKSVLRAAEQIGVSRRSLYRAGLSRKKNRPPRRTT